MTARPDHAPVVGVSVRTELLDPQGLGHDELRFLARAGDRRRREFATGRACARAALRQIGAPVPSLLPDDDGVPQWPAGFVGSITHTAGWVGSVAVRSDRGGAPAGVGLDAEVLTDLSPGVVDVVTTGAERERLGRLTGRRPGTAWPVVLFSAKEAAYKAWYPSRRRLAHHEQVGVDLRPDGSFVATIDGDALRGRWVTGSGLVVSLALLRS